MNERPYGTSVQVRGEFRNPDGDLFDPTTVRCLIQAPDGTQTTYLYGTDVALVKESTGIYYLWFLPSTDGRWAYRFKSTGPQSVANENAFTVTRSMFTTP